MKKTLYSAVALAVLMVVGAPGLAQAAEACQPKDAYTETITAAYDEKVIDQAYVPGVPAVEEVSHTESRLVTEAYDETVIVKDAYDETVVVTPAWDETVVISEAYDETVVDEPEHVVHHDAVTHTEWKYERHGGPGEIWVPSNEFKYIDKNGNGTNSKPSYGTYYERTSKTKTVVDCEAWDETIPATYKTVHHDAVTEVVNHPAVTKVVHHDAETKVVHHEAVYEDVKVIDVEARDAIPAIEEVSHIVSHPAVTKEHEAVVCPAPTKTSISTAVTPEHNEDELAQTGVNPALPIGLTIGAVITVLAGAWFLVAGGKRRNENKL